MDNTLNKEQRLAVYSNARFILLSAGAGSGKTFVLKNRVARLADEGLALSQLLVLTFTNEAAASMKNKIRENFVELSLKHPEKSEFYLSLSKDVDQADITTFDSFALKLVKKYRTELGLGPTIQIGDAAVLSLEKNQRLNILFEEEYKKLEETLVEDRKKGTTEPLYRFLKEYAHRNDSFLKTAIFSLMDEAERQSNPLEFLQQFQGKFSDISILNEQILALGKNYLSSLNTAKELVNFYDHGSEEDGTNLASLDALLIEERISRLKGALNRRDVEEILLLFTEKYGFKKITKENFPKEDTEGKEWRNLLKEILSSPLKDWTKLKENNPNLYLLIKKLGFEHFLPYLSFISDFAIKLYTEMEQFKKQYGIFSFSDIFHFALEALKSERAKKELASTYSHILVDECQDNNDLQNELLNRLVQLKEDMSLFMVGDVKQSIYRFRHANPMLFAQREEQYGKEMKKGNSNYLVIHMPTNYRSAEEVVNGVNSLFSNLMSKDCGGVTYDESQAMIAGRKMLDKEDRNHVGFHSLLIPKRPTYQEAKKNPQLWEDFSLSNAERRAKYVAGEIAKRLEKSPSSSRENLPKDFAILLRKKSNFMLYAKALADLSIPVKVINEVDLNDEPVVMTLLSSFRFLNYYHQYIQSKTDEEKERNLTLLKHPFASLYRSYLTDNFMNNDLLKLDELFDTNKWLHDDLFLKLEKIYEDCKDKSPVVGLEVLISSFNVILRLPYLGEIQENYQQINAMRGYAKTYEQLGNTFLEFVAFLSEGVEDEQLTFTPSKSEKDAVKIMTIHASKGLDFSYVYLPELSWSMLKREDKAFSSTYGPLLSNSSFGFSLQPLGAILSRKEEREETISELVRLLYVAATRAIEECIFVYDEKEEANPSSRYGKYVSYVKKEKDLSCSYSIASIVSFEDMILASTLGNNPYQVPRKEKARLGKTYTRTKSEIGDSSLSLCFPSLKKNYLTLRKDSLTTHRPSKELGDEVNPKDLLFGNMLHRAMEISDTKNGHPYENLPQNLKKYVEQAFNTPLMKEIRSAKEHFKEYTYLDESGVEGQIDLLCLWEDKAYIIDYKASSIVDPDYDLQLLSYKHYVEKTFPMLKEVRCFLLSLLHPEKTREVVEELR